VASVGAAGGAYGEAAEEADPDARGWFTADLADYMCRAEIIAAELFFFRTRLLT
jgi:hypothetical protein